LMSSIEFGNAAPAIVKALITQSQPVVPLPPRAAM
jgi:hypothetical protein